LLAGWVTYWLAVLAGCLAALAGWLYWLYWLAGWLDAMLLTAG